jgi:hypothetical protein
LTAIKGIGQARQQYLKESLGARTFRDLAALSASEIESRLKAEGQVIFRGEIDRWIAQAKEYASAADPPSLRAVEAVGANKGREANSSPRQSEWQPFASFVVEFQARQVSGRTKEQRTTVHHMEADKGETWPDIQGERLWHWVLEQLGKEVRQELKKPLPQEPRAVELLAEAQPAAASPVTLAVAQLCAFQPPQADKPTAISEAGRPFQGSVKGGESFALATSLALTGPGAAEIAKRQITYRAQFYARSLSTGERTYLGDTRLDTLVEGKMAYTAVLTEASLPPGIYRLRVLTMLQSMRTAPGYLEVPLLQVV